MSIFNFITQKPKLSLIAIALLLITALMGSSNFKLDASSETLLLENDPDLKLYRDSIDTYGSTDFLVVTVTPFKSIFEESSIDTLKKLIKGNDIKTFLGMAYPFQTAQLLSVLLGLFINFCLATYAPPSPYF